MLMPTRVQVLDSSEPLESLEVSRPLPLRERPLSCLSYAVVEVVLDDAGPGPAQLAELAVARVIGGGDPEIVLETLLRPDDDHRLEARARVLGVSPEVVAAAPTFGQIADVVAACLAGRVLVGWEASRARRALVDALRRAGHVADGVPTIAVGDLALLVGAERGLSLDLACRRFGVPVGHDVRARSLACGRLLQVWLGRLVRDQGTSKPAALMNQLDAWWLPTLRGELLSPPPCCIDGSWHRLRPRAVATLDTSSPAANDSPLAAERHAEAPSPGSAATNDTCADTRCASEPVVEAPSGSIGRAEPGRGAHAGPLRLYFDALLDALRDLEPSDDTIAGLRRMPADLGLTREQVQAIHARLFAAMLMRYNEGDWLDATRGEHLRKLHAALSRLGWAPGE